MRFRGAGTRNDNPAFCGSVVKADYSSFMERFFWVTKNSMHIDVVALQDVIIISITPPLEAAFTAGSVLVGTSGAGRREKERDGREEARYCYHFAIVHQREGETQLPNKVHQREGKVQLPLF